MLIGIPTKSYVDSPQKNSRYKRDSLAVINDQVNEFDKNRLSNLDSITVKRVPSSDNEQANRKLIDRSIGEGTKIRFNQILQNYLNFSVANDVYDFAICDKLQITETTIINCLKNRGYLLQRWIIKCNDENINDKIQKFMKSTKRNSPTGYLRAIFFDSYWRFIHVYRKQFEYFA